MKKQKIPTDADITYVCIYDRATHSEKWTGCADAWQHEKQAIARAKTISSDVRTVLFDPLAYHIWRDGKPDTKNSRARWALETGKFRDGIFPITIGLKVGPAYRKPGTNQWSELAIGWAVIEGARK